MSASETVDDRRRHERRRVPLDVPLDVEVHLGGARLVPVRVLDASPGGLLLELADGEAPPPLSARGHVRMTRGDVVVERPARVVRIRWRGRERGRRLPPAIALSFDAREDGEIARLLARPPD